MATISARIRNLSLRYKLALGFTVTFILVTAASFIAIYQLSEHNRQEEFYRRLKDRTLTTFKILLQVDQINTDMLTLFDKNTINSLYSERIVLLDSNGTVIYNNGYHTPTDYPRDVFLRLKQDNSEQRSTEGKVEVLGVKFFYKNQMYYGIARAYDRFGIRKLQFLKILLIGTAFVTAVIFIFFSLYISKIITLPITRLTKDIDQITPKDLSVRVQQPGTSDEVGFLANRFNELLERVEDAFKFQYHFIHHASHELKTPLAVLIANSEKTLTEHDLDIYKRSLEFNKSALMELSYMINAMLDLSKAEHNLLPNAREHVRLDELLFECFDELSYLDSDVQFNFSLSEDFTSSNSLTISGNTRILKIAIMNLLKNAINFSTNKSCSVNLVHKRNYIELHVNNDGETIPESDQKMMFKHFFRGRNSNDTKGFGLGLVLVERIITMHEGVISYDAQHKENRFVVTLPLAFS